jgi:uncharacterized coiled-coil DUF342 family protein
MEKVSNSELKKRFRQLSDKMESLWEKIHPLLTEFDQCKTEFDMIYDEMLKRDEITDES